MSLAHVSGDATLPQKPGTTLIVHCCNDVAAWGAGFVLALSKRWPKAEEAYRYWSSCLPKPVLGQVQIVEVGDGVHVANLIGQHGTRSRTNPCPVSYVAIETGLAQVADWCLTTGANVQMPKMGAGLAGGNWESIEKIVVAELVSKGITVTVCTFGA